MNWISPDKYPENGNILVLLEKESLGRRIHSASVKDGKPWVIGHHFAFDVGEVVGWLPMSALPEPPTAPISENQGKDKG